MSVSSCCLQGFEWEGIPKGQNGKLVNNDSYITGENPNNAILIIHDILGWEFPNIRLLADHYAREANAMVYVPDFFGGDSLPSGPILSGKWNELDVDGFMSRNTRQIREFEILECAKALREQHQKVAAVGFCYGGWAVFRLGAKDHADVPLVDCIVAGHPTFLTKEDIDNVAVPVQLLAPEHDPMFTFDLKLYSFETLQKVGVPFDYQHFPGVQHGSLVRGDKNQPGEREAMVRAKNAAISWIKMSFVA
ncbi:hypothetical protein AtubIFM57258_004610 [Aspergillus tubingensis]|nr:hypothetical protein AtubIFM57258_004610 [Aspergillus tubingensis]